MGTRDVEELFLQNQEREQALRTLLKTRPSESRDVSLAFSFPKATLLSGLAFAGKYTMLVVTIMVLGCVCCRVSQLPS